MRFKFTHFVIASLFTLATTNAYSLIDASLQIGKRSATFDTDSSDTDVGATDVTLSAHITPIPLPLVSVGLGLAVTAIQWDKDEIAGSDYTASEAAGLDVALESMVAVKIPFLFTPYAKLAYNLSHKLAYTYEDTTDQKVASTLSGSGYTIGIGAKFSILPFISAMLEYSMFNGKLETDEVKVEGTKIPQADVDAKVKSSSILAGLEVDIGF